MSLCGVFGNVVCCAHECRAFFAGALGGPGVGGKQGLVVAGWERLSTDYAKAVADLQNWTAQIYFRTEEALNYRFARETDTAVIGGIFAEGEDAVSTRGAHLSERAARWPHACTAMAQIQSQINRIV
ncbi:hypothetical protein TcBrA4_0026020 [Trypanosoma cruzi]|nr:hypothetical protein TcBrA4_0026020 [Trypanosoma cruzi]